jgi:4-hydroxy-3-polyprenylbenzoate decarboxylase
MGSKVVLAAVGPPIRELPTEVPSDLKLPDGFGDPRVALPGILAVQSPKSKVQSQSGANSTLDFGLWTLDLNRFCQSFTPTDAICRFPLIVLVDDSDFAARNLANFLWVTFTRSNPAADIGGIGEFTRDKHWGCEGALVIDARIKPQHAPPLVEDPLVAKRIDALAARGGPLARWL